jgi:hypothetical protein
MKCHQLPNALLSMIPCLAILLAVPDRISAQSSTTVECQPVADGVQSIRNRIDAASNILSDMQLRCAFADFNVGSLSTDCRKVKDDAYGNQEKRRAWSDVVTAWDALDRTSLALRQIEDRLGIQCLER